MKDAQWVRNGAGFHHSDQHGFGLMDALRLTLTAAHWPLLPPMVNYTTAKQVPNAPIPRNGSPLIRAIYGTLQIKTCSSGCFANYIEQLLHTWTHAFSLLCALKKIGEPGDEARTLAWNRINIIHIYCGYLSSKHLLVTLSLSLIPRLHPAFKCWTSTLKNRNLPLFSVQH